MERFMERNGVFFDDEMIKKYRAAGISRDQLLADALDKLNDYEDAEEEGRLLILPCAVGSRVYEVVKLDTYDGLGNFLKSEIRIEEYEFTLEWCGTLKDFGKIILTTREAAEQRKAELERDEHS